MCADARKLKGMALGASTVSSRRVLWIAVRGGRIPGSYGETLLLKEAVAFFVGQGDRVPYDRLRGELEKPLALGRSHDVKGMDHSTKVIWTALESVVWRADSPDSPDCRGCSAS